MLKKTKKDEDADIKRFKDFVTKILGKEDAKVFAENNAIWEEKIEKDEPELENFVLKAIEFDNAACAVILMDDWMKRMNHAEDYEKWTKNTPQIKKRILDDVYFQIKAFFFQSNIKKYGGRKGVSERLLECSKELRKDNYEKMRALSRSLLEVLDCNPFVSNDLFRYVSIMDRMEHSIYWRRKKPLNSRVKNINSICPVEYILLTNGIAAFEMKEYPEAERFLKELLKWNPVSIHGLWYLSNVYLEQKRWKECLSMIVRGLECAYRPSHLKNFYNTLIGYFYDRNLNKDALCCNYLKMQYVSSDKHRSDIGRDFQFFSKSDEWMKKRMRKICGNYIRPQTASFDEQRKNDDCKTNKRINVSIEDIYESSKKHEYPLGVNQDVIELAKTCHKVAVRAENESDIEYFATILDDLEKCDEKKKKFFLTKSHQNIKKTVN